MAVSLSAGFEMRSDFMISDAALPMRMEEAGDFAGILAQTDGSGSGQDSLLPSDMQKLAESVAKGEIKLEDIPEELVNDELIKLVAEFEQTQPIIKENIPEQKKDEDTSIAAAFVQVDIPSDLSAEFNEIVKAVSDSANQTAALEDVLQSVPQTKEIEPIMITAVEESVQDVQTEQFEQLVETKTDYFAQAEEVSEVQPEFAAATAKLEQETQTAKADSIQQTADRLETIPNETQTISVGEVGESANGNAQNGADNSSQEFFSEAQLVQVPKEQLRPQEQELFKNAEITVQTKQTEQEPQQMAQTEMQLGAQAGQGRVKAASDELELLRSAVKKPEGEQTAQSTQSPLMSQSTVVFTVQDGKELEVKPAEVAQQITQKLAETALQTDSPETEYTMTLNPEELGEITVKLTKAADGAVSVTIAAENSRTRELLQQNGALIQENLRANGMQLEQWQTVGESQQETYAQDYNGSSKNPYQRSENAQQDSGETEDKSFAEIIASM